MTCCLCHQVPLCESFGESLNLLLRLRFAPKDSVSDDDWRRLHAALHKLHSGTTSTRTPHNQCMTLDVELEREVRGMALSTQSRSPGDPPSLMPVRLCVCVLC